LIEANALPLSQTANHLVADSKPQSSVTFLALCHQEGEGLMKQHHYASRDIADQIEHLELTWKSLLAASEEKKERLQQAYQVWSAVSM